MKLSRLRSSADFSRNREWISAVLQSSGIGRWRTDASLDRPGLLKDYRHQRTNNITACSSSLLVAWMIGFLGVIVCVCGVLEFKRAKTKRQSDKAPVVIVTRQDRHLQPHSQSNVFGLRFNFGGMGHSDGEFCDFLWLFRHSSLT